MRKIILFILFIIFHNVAFADDDNIKNEIQIKSDNDFFIPLFGTDKYYTYGQKIIYRRRINNLNGMLLNLNRFFRFHGSTTIFEFEIG